MFPRFVWHEVIIIQIDWHDNARTKAWLHDRLCYWATSTGTKSHYQSLQLEAHYIPHEDYVAFIEQFGSDVENFLKERGVIDH